MRAFVWFAVLLSLVLAEKFVNVQLQSNWKETPLTLEISEFVASENKDLFWNFIEELGTLPQDATERDRYERTRDILRPHLSNNQQDLLEFAVNLRYFSPRVEMHNQIATTTLSELSEEQRTRVGGCLAWALVGGSVTCDPSELGSMIGATSEGAQRAHLELDHVFPGSSHGSKATVFLFATVGTKEFVEFHAVLKGLANEGKVRYVLRHLVPPSSRKLNLPGYGVELAIKSLEYKAEDDSKVQGGAAKDDITISEDEEEVQGFLFGVLQKRKPHLSAELSTFKSTLLANDEKFEDLKVWAIKDLGYLASQRLITSSNPLKLLRDISQNFPTHANSLARIKLNETLKESLIEGTKQIIPIGQSVVLVNGRVVEPAKVDPFTLYQLMKEEAEKLDSLMRLYIPKKDAFRILSIAQAVSEESQVFAINGDKIAWYNDMEKDSQYAQWPSNFNEIFRRVWPGSFRYVARNFFSAVVVLNPSVPSSSQLLTMLESFVHQNVPIRVGFLFVTEPPSLFAQKLRQEWFELEENLALKAMRLFSYLQEKHASRVGITFLRLALQMSGNEGLNEYSLRSAFHTALNQMGDSSNNFDELLSTKIYDESIKEMNRFVVSKGFQTLPVAFLNGAAVEVSSPDQIGQGIINQYFMQTQAVQAAVRDGKLKPDMDIYKELLSQPGVLARFNSLVLGLDEKLSFLPLAKSGRMDGVLSSVQYYTNPDDQDSVKHVTHIVAADFSTLQGLEIAREALNHLELAGAQNSRVGLLFKGTTPTARLIANSMMAARTTHILAKSLKFAKELLGLAISKLQEGGDAPLDLRAVTQLATTLGLKVEKLSSTIEEMSKQTTLGDHASFCSDYLPAEGTAIVTNGRIVKVPPHSGFDQDDFQFLGQYEYDKRAKQFIGMLESITFTDLPEEKQTTDHTNDIVMKVISVLGIDEQNGVRKITLPEAVKSSFTFESESKEATFLVTAFLNPLSVDTQRFAPILEALTHFFDVKVDVVLNPVELTELPLKNFYSYVMPEKTEFDANGRWSGPRAVFHHLPEGRLFTLNLDTPERWLVTPVLAPYDLDNLRLKDIEDRVVYAEFELVNILVEGNCYELNSVYKQLQAPPRGLELVLGTQTQPNTQDTIVMSNLGYFQLKANPGVWDLALKAESRSTELFQISSGNGTMEKQTVALSDFLGSFVPLRAQKRPGKEGEQLLVEKGDEVHEHNVWDSFSGMWAQKAGVDTKAKDETIHVFSLASGHLYERFLKIMILSVIKQTKSPVKFWLLANFLSPKFKDFIPHMAKKYNFQYELVTYKWPSWLHKQTEKQRVIWGYKILFLDVLFPLDLKKVIYVDADQVVRSDLKELWDMNLHGAPYAYTPFCDDNAEMNGFRFWKQGFWQNHLRGLPYHISALYVVDLKQFRRLASGDTLRATYDQLSQDPNSLANLDQDLPNYLQHMVKIHSLPKEWLWCETWCSQESKERAKTIDLCNNPLTKTPKLVSAVKILPEWTDLDNEVKSVEKEAANGEL